MSIDGGGYESRGTFKNIMRKSIIQNEEAPRSSNKTVLPPSLSDKLFKQFQKTQKFLRSETGKAIRSNNNS